MNKKNGIRFILTLATTLLLLLAVVNATNPDESDFSKAWKFDSAGWTFDPSKWNDTMKERMYKVSAGSAWAAYMGMTAPMMIGMAVFLFGLVKLNWPLVIAVGLTIYGWKKGHRPAILAGAFASYALAFGVKLIQ